jgi:hypothetical protein
MHHNPSNPHILPAQAACLMARRGSVFAAQNATTLSAAPISLKVGLYAYA